MARGVVVAIVIVCFTAGSAGCSWTATIARSDGPDTEGEIEHSDAGALYVRARNGRIYRIDRDVIVDIDHPGNVEMLVGALLGGFISAMAVTDHSTSRDDLTALLIIYGGTGLALILSGLVRWIPSIRAARAFETAELPPRAAPRPGSTAFPYRPPPLPPPAPPPPPPSPPPPEHDEEPQVIPDATSPP